MAVKKKGGFTVAELLLAALFGMIVMASLYGFYRQQMFSLLVQEAKTATLEDARGAMDIMVRELRNAGSWGTGVAPPGCFRVAAATPAELRIQADLDGNGDCGSGTGEDVTYDLSGATPTCPGSVIRRNGACLVGNVATPVPGRLFTYYDGKNTDLGASPSLAIIKRIKIAFSVEMTNPDPRTRGEKPRVISVLSSSVQLRN